MSTSNANYSYPLSRYPTTNSPSNYSRPANHQDSQPLFQQQDTSARVKKSTMYASSRSTFARPSTAPSSYVLPKEMLSDVPFSLASRPHLNSTAVVKGHERRDSRFDDACEVDLGRQVGAHTVETDVLKIGGTSNIHLLVPQVSHQALSPPSDSAYPITNRSPFGPISINIQAPDPQRAQTKLPQRLPTTNLASSLKPSTRNYSLSTFAGNMEPGTKSEQKPSSVTSPKSRKHEQHTPNRLRKPNTSSPNIPKSAGKREMADSQANNRRSSWKMGGGAKMAVERKEDRYREKTGAQVIPSLQQAFEPPLSVGSQFRSRIPLPVAPEVPIMAANTDMASRKTLALSIASDPFADPRMRKKGSLASLGRRKEGKRMHDDMDSKQGGGSTEKTARCTNLHHGLPLPPIPTVQPSTTTISKKKSMLAFTASIGQKSDFSPTATAEKRIGGLVKMPSGGFGLRRVKPTGANGTASQAPGDISFSSGQMDGETGCSNADALLCVPTAAARERPSTDSNQSMMSDWTITNLSDISFDLPGAEREHYLGTTGGEEQNGGVPSSGAFAGRKLGKKKSFAAAGVFLGKILHGAGDKKEKRKSEVAYKDLPKRLRNEASTMTLRPTNPSTDESFNTTVQSGPEEAYVRERSPSPASTIRSKDTRHFHAILGPTPATIDSAYRQPFFPRAGHLPPPENIGYDRAKSPELPSLHFPRLSYTGTNFRADWSSVGNALEMAPPVPSLPASLSFAIKQEFPILRLANPDDPSPMVDARTPASEYAESAAIHATSVTQNATVSAHSVNSSLDQTQYSTDDSGGSSLVHVEHALDIEDEYSFISKNSSIVNGGEKRLSGKLPWRRSVQGVFITGENDARREGRDTFGDNLPTTSSLDKRPSLMDLKKVSNMTGSLQALVAAYSASRSTLNDTGECAIDEAGSNDDSKTGRNLVTQRLDSPSSSHIMEHDSPTPMRKYGHNCHDRGSTLRMPRLAVSPLRISPLRLALGNSTVKSQQERHPLKETGNHPSRRIFEDNPFLTSKKASMAPAPPPTLSKELGPRLRHSTVSSISSSDAEDESPLAGRISISANNLGLPPLPASLMRHSRTSKDTDETVSSLDRDALARGSFDFTEEYRALNENGSRQSFVDELERLGLSSGEDSFHVENTVSIPCLEPELRLPVDCDRSFCGRKTREPFGHARRNSYGFNKNFKFGVTKKVSSSTANSGSSNSMTQTTLGVMCSPPKEPLPIPQFSLGSNNRFRFRQNGPEDSMFSIATMSSVGPVVDTGIAGNDFINVFDREFGAVLAARDRSFNSHPRSSNTSIDSSSNVPVHLRRPSHARILSFASVTSRSGSFQHPAHDIGHHRHQSSLDSNLSILRKIGLPNIDNDRMFETDNRKKLYSIQGSPAASTAPCNPVTKPSKDSILDSSRHLTARDSILDSTEDSIFHSGIRKGQSSTFVIKSMRPLSHISDAAEPKASISPLVVKIQNRNDNLEDSLLDSRAREPEKPEEEIVEQCLIADSERSIEALLSPEHSEFSSHQSTDVHSIISTMVDADFASKSRWSRRLKGLSQLSEQGVTLVDGSLQSSSDKRLPVTANITQDDQIPQQSERKGLLTRWVDYQRLAEEEVLKSKTAWQDSANSVKVISDFVPPRSAEGIRSIIRNSLDLNQPLCEASPGTQVARRELHELESGMEGPEPHGGPQKFPVVKPLALPTKFMRADSAKSGNINSFSETVDSRTPVSAVFAKFALPAEPSLTRYRPTIGPVVVKSGNAVTADLESKKLKQQTAMRSRVNSTARRVSLIDKCKFAHTETDLQLHLQQKLGWTRRKEAGPVSPLNGKRTVAKMSHRSLRDSNKENAVQTQ
ncbi:hypothetical protein QFC19_004555 [Naganishia cerealis]|uniref:Uncharacterized protein n=2 Tax=Naganishia cerealis TaxID=610337 RepID=A0ACC2VUI3_9TREE|nr:hypothetical protein QFC19_004555 [Naganishia cerealis]